MGTATQQTIRDWGDTLVVIQCCSCGIKYAVPELFNNSQREIGGRGGWTCPNGHSQIYLTTRADELEREVTRLNARMDQKDAEIKYQREQRYSTERSLKATKGVVTKLKKPAKAGVCPCCNRTFKQLASHMACKHPEFATSEAGATP